jgi:hypothetical protein
MQMYRSKIAAPMFVFALVACLIGMGPGLWAQMNPSQKVDSFSGKPRVAIISDIGNEPDDQMSFVRLLLYSNEFDIEAMIATTDLAPAKRIP